MRKLLIILSILFAFVSSQGQIRTNPFYTVPVAAVSYYAEYQPIHDTLTAWGVAPHDTVADIQNDFIYELDTAGITLFGTSIWSDDLDGMYVFAGQDSMAGLLELTSLAPTRKLTLHGNVTFDQFEGFTGGGSDGNDYGDTHWDPSNDGVNWTQNSAFMAVYYRTTVNEQSCWIGSTNGTCKNYLSLRYGGQALTSINTNIPFDPGVETTLGLGAVDRTASNLTTAYLNSVNVGSSANTTVTLSSVDFHIFGYNNQGTSANNGTNELSIVMWGGSLGAVKEGYLNTICERFMDRLYKGVQ